MCGILGMVMRSQSADWDRAAGALHLLQHRGPDAEAMAGIDFTGNPVAANHPNARIILGFRRLAILDLSARSDQPMRCAHTGNLLVFNGEIYNFPELKQTLEALGHSFATEGDAEVVLAAYREWGEAAFARS